MSRRRYNAGSKAGSPIVDESTIDPDCDWDAEEIQTALRQAIEIEDSDPISARNLRAQAEAAQSRLSGGSKTTVGAYDPMRLYARILYHYKGGISDRDFATMDYRRFFGYVRELQDILDEEAEAQKGTPKQNPASALRHFGSTEEYSGDTVKLI